MRVRGPGIINFFFSLNLLLVCAGKCYAQKSLSGNLGMPAVHVVTIGNDRVSVDDVTGFNAAGGDTILLIQMQGVMIQLDPSFGYIQDKYGEPGLWEFLITQSVNPITKEIVFTKVLSNTYDTKGNIQIVKVPYYNSASVTNTLTVDGWDPEKKTGGVLALIIGRTLKLSADIDLTGKGFRGGNEDEGDGICVYTNDDEYGKKYYNDDFTNAGFKGEGIANYTQYGYSLIPDYIKGYGPAFTGGGGGNGRYSGGGGGSHRGKGGDGGKEDALCTTPFIGGIGGFKGEHPSLMDRLFMGGGGGASTKAASGGTTGPGGNGGGIVIIVADSIIGNGGSIRASGSPGADATGDAGAGGGGAGGSIAISVNSYGNTPLALYVNGGKGGDRNNLTGGEGGGGGGGLLWVKSNITPNVTVDYAGGEAGSSYSDMAKPGDPGNKKLEFNANLNGFLFNSIRSSITGNQIDSVCSNMKPPMISGTTPVGGNEPYTYTWEKSYDLSTWEIVATGTKDYTPAVEETNTVYFRRTVTDNSSPSLVDISKPVQIIVQPSIKNNIVGPSDIICFAQDPPTLVSLATLQDGNGIYSFKWQVSTDETNYALPVNDYTTENYTPPPELKITSWYRRTVTSGRCVDSSAIAKITVLDTIKNNNIISPAEEICDGMTFTNLTATTPPVLQGGDGTYRYKWEYSADATSWADATGMNTGAGYDPDETIFPGTAYFRRVVRSGNNDVCENRSKPVSLTSWPVIANDTISGDQTICSGSMPESLTGTVPINGNGTYSYLWQMKTKSTLWNDAPGPEPIDQINYSPPTLTDTAWFRRIVTSSACTDISNTIVVNVHKPISGNDIHLQSGLTDTTICSGAIPKCFIGSVPIGGTDIPGDYAYQWESSLTETAGYTQLAGAIGKDYQHGAITNATALPVTHYFRRMVMSGTCSSPGNIIIKVTVLPSISNNIITPDKTAVCYNSSPFISGTPLTGGDGIPTWLWIQSPDGNEPYIPAAGVNNQQNYTPPPLTNPVKYRRVIMSGFANCCIDTSNIVSININPLPTGQITTVTDTTVCSGFPVPIKIHLTGAPKWNVIYTENGMQKTLSGISSPDTILIINNLPAGTPQIYNYTLYKVTDNNGCEATSLKGSRKIEVYRVPVANAGEDASICGMKYTLTAIPSVGTGVWSFPPDVSPITELSNKVTVAIIDSLSVPDVIKKKFYWTETNWTCSSTDSVEITFYKRTSIADAGPDKDLYTFDLVDTLHALKPLVGTGTWNVISGGAVIINDSIVTRLGYGQNIFEWKVVNGLCQSADEMVINVHELKIPEGFSPNSDGINDEFEIQGLDLNYSECTLRIINSAGTEVFFTSNVNGNSWKNWNGENGKGPLPEGTYYYLLTVRSKRNDTMYRQSGFIILKRYNSQ
ncbi:MAG: gliding motility-associated C-terminal domain-containing protein [Bacteroidales bacterium]|nr:gliding motility-associated C-terminal domain-containing protein [Bacteroidales bacterium]